MLLWNPAYQDETSGLRSACQSVGGWVPPMWSDQLTSCLAELCLCTMYSVHCEHSPVQTSETGNPSQFLSSLRNEQWRQELVIIVPDEKFGS